MFFIYSMDINLVNIFSLINSIICSQNKNVFNFMNIYNKNNIDILFRNYINKLR